MGVRPTEIKIVVTGLTITLSMKLHIKTNKQTKILALHVLNSINLLINFKGRETGRGKSQRFHPSK